MEEKEDDMKVAGVEKKTRKKLIEKFGSIEALAAADEQEIASVEVTMKLKQKSEKSDERATKQDDWL
eukprot:559713-Hanusia_phi.AAC.2